MNFELLVASYNTHKIQEIRDILSPHKITVYGPGDLNLPTIDIKEDGATYFENALIKANAISRLVEMPIIADDSGLEVEALNHKPGLFSSRFVKEIGGQEKANEYIINAVKGKSSKAQFICNIVLINVENKPLLFEGVTKGNIVQIPNGNNGFGYDPIFFIEEKKKTYASLSKEEKNHISHRHKALKKLLTYLIINGYAK